MKKGNKARKAEPVTRHIPTREDTAIVPLHELLRGDIANAVDAWLPPVRQLCLKFCVSAPTLLKALNMLRQEGLIRYSRGSRIVIVGRLQPETGQKKKMSSVDCIADKIREKILCGALSSGRPLPKYLYYTATSNISFATMSAVMRKLAAEKLIYKRGKNWIVGAPLTSDIVRIVSDPATILVLAPDPGRWRNLCVHSWTSDFCRAFVGEADTHEVVIETVLIDDTNYPGVTTAGIDNIIQKIKRLGQRYRGMLIPVTVQELQHILPWLPQLFSLQRPVFWYNFRSEPLPKPLPVQEKSLIYHCTNDFKKGLQLIVTALADLGHRGVCLLDPRNTNPEEIRHYVQLSSLAHSKPAVRIITNVPDFWDQFFHGSPWENLHRLHAHGLPHVRKFLSPYIDMQKKDALNELEKLRTLPRGSVVSYSPVLVPVLNDRKVTAIVCLENRQAIFCYYWFRAAAVSLPDDISVLTIGSSQDIMGLPISIIDPGHSYLGYCAFHALIGDIPIKKTNTGEVEAIFRFVNRGSVGHARPRRNIPGLHGDLQ